MDDPRHRPHMDALKEGEEPSTLFAVWSDREAPLEEEVRLALLAEWPGITQVDELDPGEELLWGCVYRIPALGDQDHTAEYFVWAEARGDLSDGFLESGLDPGPELDEARAARWLVGVETVLDPDAPQASFQAQLRVVQNAAVPGLVAVYDDNALVVRSGGQVRELAEGAAPPRASTLFAIHSLGADDGIWLHTHGLTRAGLHEIDFVGLQEEDVSGAYDLIDAVVDALLAGVQPDGNDIVTLGVGLDVRLLPLDRALPLLPAAVAGGRGDREGEMEDHGGDRLIVFDSRHPVPPRTALARIGRTGTLYKSRQETRRQRTLSLSRWGTFGQLFAIHRNANAGWRFHVKAAYPQESGGDTQEHLWFSVLELRPGRIRGRLLNDPLDVSFLAREDEAWVPLDRLTDWVIVTPEGTYDPELASVLLD